MPCRRQRRVTETDEEEPGRERHQTFLRWRSFFPSSLLITVYAEVRPGSFTVTTRSSPLSPPPPPHRRRRPQTLAPSSSAPSRRRTSASMATPTKRNCQTIRASLDALDLSSSTQLQILSFIRRLVLFHLEQLEASLPRPQSPIDIDSLKSSTEDAVEDVREWANDALDMLRRIRSDVCSHLPDLVDLDFSLENLVSHLPDVNDVRSHLPDINISDQVREKIDLLCSCLPDLPFQAPLDYIPILTEHLDSLHTHLSCSKVGFTVPSVSVQRDIGHVRVTYTPCGNGRRSIDTCVLAVRKFPPFFSSVDLFID